jgi:hypothetical protein
MSDEGSEIFSYNNIPSWAELVVKLFFDDTCNLTEFLGLKYVSDISDFFNGCI